MNKKPESQLGSTQSTSFPEGLASQRYGSQNENIISKPPAYWKTSDAGIAQWKPQIFGQIPIHLGEISICTALAPRFALGPSGSRKALAEALLLALGCRGGQRPTSQRTWGFSQCLGGVPMGPEIHEFVVHFCRQNHTQTIFNHPIWVMFDIKISYL